ncbi:MAG TPA: TonB-dependent receptor [Rhodanobacteraceae bacterium]|nr:TonB-dependent receptor [Rhodanobacteraceae bacterium]
MNATSMRAASRVRTLTLAVLLSLAGGIGVSHAQSVTGGLHGKAPRKATVTVTRADTGYARTVDVDQQGTYSVNLLMPGHYQVKVVEDGQVLGRYTVNVNPNMSAVVPAVVTSLGTIEVTAAPIDFSTVINPIDVTTPEVSTIYDARLLHDLPLNQLNIYQIPKLDSAVRTAGMAGRSMPQIGGASPSENRYYYNNFDTSYDVNGDGTLTLPQEAIQSTQLVTGSAALSLASTTGGIILSTVKQGTNDFHAGYTATWTPATSRLASPRGRDTYNSQGQYYIYQSHDTWGPSLHNFVWASGPVVKDKVFFYALFGRSYPSRSTSYGGSTKDVYSSDNKDALVNLTWNITNRQSLDLMGTKQWYNYSTVEYQLNQSYTTSIDPDSRAWTGEKSGQKLFIGNYSWQMTDNLQLRLMGAYTRDHINDLQAIMNQPYVTDYDWNMGVSHLLHGSPGGSYEPTNFWYAKRGYQGQLVWEVGEHTLKAGINDYTNYYHYQPQTNPLGNWTYYYNLTPGTLWDGAAVVPPNGQIAYTFQYTTGGTFTAKQKSYYVQDLWQVAPRWLLSYGVRYDKMANQSTDGSSYLSMNVWSPRIGLAWDVHGDSTLKIGANAGKYTLPMPSNLSYTIASPQTYIVRYYAADKRDPATQVPVNPTLLHTTVWNNGEVPQLQALSSRNIKNTYQYEFQLYAQQQLTPSWSLLAKADASIIKNVVDQVCDDTGLISDYIHQHGHPNYAGLVGNCTEFNPSRSIVLRDDLDNNGKLQDITIPNSYLGFPRPQRKYYDMTLRLTHARTAQQPWYLSGSYTWAHLYGNWDGYTNLTRSTTPEPGESGDYLFPELTVGSNGNLAGDVRHSFTLSGEYYWHNGLRIGGVLYAHTGSAYSCFGSYPDPSNAVLIQERQIFHYCVGKLSPQGSAWRAPFFWQLDFNIGYDWDMGKAGKLSVSLNIFNLTNRQGVLSRDMTGDQGNFDANGQVIRSPWFMAPSSLQSPRYTSLYLRYAF